MKTTRSLLLVTCALGAAAPAGGQTQRTVAVSPVLTHRPVSQTAKIGVWSGQETATTYLVTSIVRGWRSPRRPGETIVYDIDIANNGPGQAVLVGVAQTTTNLDIQPRAGACRPVPGAMG
jgi:hypothetical protein